MRVVVAGAGAPFDQAGARLVAERLAGALRDAEHQAEAIFLPLDPEPDRAVAQMLASRLTDVSHEGELMVTIGWPAHLLEHHDKVVWFGIDPHDEELPEQAEAAVARAVAAARRVLSASDSARRHLLDRHGIETDLVGAPPEPGAPWGAVVDRLLA